MSESKLKKMNEKIAKDVTEGFHKIENGVVGSYQKIENRIVEDFSKITDIFVGKFLTHEGESVEDAKKRLADEQTAREAANKKAAAKRTAEKQSIAGVSTDVGQKSMESSLDIAKSSVEASKH